MHSADNDTHWIDLLKAGDTAAAQPLWERYFARLVDLARTRLQGARRRAADEEDVALSAFASFCRGAEQGRFPQLDDSDDLWQVLIMITKRKASDLHKHETRRKRGGGQVRGDSALPSPDGDGGGMDEVVGNEPTPEQAAEMAEAYRWLLDRLPDDTLRTLAQLKVELYSNSEMAERVGCSLATVERKLKRIRSIWERPRETT